jgi:hypothetical protein
MKSWRLQTLLIFGIVPLFTSGSYCQLRNPKENHNAIVIPLDLSTQRPILKLLINGKGPYQFIFDTGSSGSVIDEELANKLELEIIGQDHLQTPGSDNEVMSEKVKVPGVTFSGTNLSEDAIMNTLAIRKMLPVEGVLSMNFFTDYAITVDYPNSKLVLAVGELNREDKNVTPYVQKSGVINLDVFIDGNKLEAHLDSGNPGGIDIPFSLKDKLNFKEEPSEVGAVNTPAASFKKRKASLLGDIKIGNVTYRNPDVNLIEGFQFVNLGYQVFSDLKITIDQKNSLMRFEKSALITDQREREKYHGEKNDYTGWYGGHERKISLENGAMYLQRGGAAKIKLVQVKDDEYEMTFDLPLRNELPNVRFERDGSSNIKGLTFISKDGREEFVKKD